MCYGKAKKLDLTLLQIFLFVTPFLFGAFYEFASFFVQIFILIIFLIKILKEKKFTIYLNGITLALAIISLGYLITCIYAIDRGMAFLGFLKFTIPLTFVLLIMQYRQEQVKEMLKSIPISGIVMIVLSLLFRYVPFLPNEFYLPNGRMGGFFQYSNTFALFLLIGIICLAYSNEKIINKVWGIAILLIGIFLSGSRAVFVLTILNFIVMTIKFKELRKYLIGLIGLGIIATLVYVTVTKNFTTIGRYLTTSVYSSTLLGRLLYYKDAIFAIFKHPFGLGYMGYSYIQPQIQSGVYKILYVHNDFLQLALDIGIIPMLILIIAIVKSLISKRETGLYKQILLTIVIHILFDFDLQFMFMFIILVLMLNIWNGKIKEYDVNNKISIAVISVFSMIYLYFGIVTFLHYIDKNEMATKMYPIYTEANLSIAYKYSQDDIEQANKIASKILETNAYSDLVYNIKALYYMQNQNWKFMLNNKQKAIELAKYDMSSYEEYVLMLSAAIDYYTRNDETNEAMEYVRLVAEVPSKIQKIKDKTSDIAYKLKDVPSFELSKEVQKYIYRMNMVLEN